MRGQESIQRLVNNHSHCLSYHFNHHAHRDAHAWDNLLYPFAPPTERRQHRGSRYLTRSGQEHLSAEHHGRPRQEIHCQHDAAGFHLFQGTKPVFVSKPVRRMPPSCSKHCSDGLWRCVILIDHKYPTPFRMATPSSCVPALSVCRSRTR